MSVHRQKVFWWPGPVLVAPVMLAGVARSLFLGKASLFGRLRKCHILTIHAQDATTVNRAFEPA